MSTKTPALVRELAALLVRYSLRDWQPIVEELERGDRGALARGSGRLGRDVRDSEAARAEARSRARVEEPTAPALAPVLRPEREAVLIQLRQALLTRTLLPAAGDLRNAYLALGMKQGPTRRPELVGAIIEQLNRIDAQKFDEALDGFRSTRGPDDGKAEYQRWFELIDAGRKESSTST